MKKKLFIPMLMLAGTSLFYTSCKKDKKDETVDETPTPTTTPTLYERVGGTTMVSDPKNSGTMIEQGRLTLRSVVDSAIYVIAADPKMVPYFSVLLNEVQSTPAVTTGFATLSKNFTDFLCSATGSKNTAYAYTGKSMKDAHDHTTNPRITMRVTTDADFNQFVGDIGIALAKNGVNATTNGALVNDLVALLNTTKADIVQTPATRTLYDRVGGTVMVADPKNSSTMIETGRLTLRCVVDSAIYVIAGDPAMTPYFATLLGEVGNNNTTGFAALSKNFTDFLCSATGSKNTAYAYMGKSMKDAHNPATNPRMGKKTNAADFDKFVGDIGTALAKNGVNSTNNKSLVNDLVTLLYTTRPDVVQQ